MTTPVPNFKKMLIDGGIPTDAAGFSEKFNQELLSVGSIYSNPSQVSPFKRIFTALIVTPALWLINALIISYLPQSFLLTATDIWLDVLAWAMGIERKQEVSARGYITFIRENTTGDLIIPAETVINSVGIDGRIYSMAVSESATMLDTVGTLTILCEATEAGTANNLPEGLYSIVPETLPTISSVSNDTNWLLIPGANTETDNELRERCRIQFGAVNQWHIDAVYRAMISKFDGVIAKNIYFDNDAPRGPATCDAYILLETGNPSEEFLQTIADTIMLDGNHGHGDDIAIFAMPEMTHDVTAIAWPVDGLTLEQESVLMSNISTFIRCAFRENSSYDCTRTQPLSRFSFSVLTKELHNQFADLYEIQFSNDAIISEINIARIGTLTVTQGDA